MEIRTEPKEAERLQALSKYEILDSPREPVFDDLTALAADLCEVPISLITFLDGTREWFKSSVGVVQREVPRENAFCAHTMLQTDVLVVPDATRDLRFADNPFVTGEPHIRFYAGYPLISADGYSLGALCVLDRIPHELDARQRQLLRTLGHEVTMLLELRRETHEKHRLNELQEAELHRLQEQLIAETAEHKRAAEDLTRRERQFADAQRLAKLGSWEWDIKTDTVVWSDELYRIFGLRPNEFKATYEDYLLRIHPDDRPKTAALIKATLETSGSFIHEKRILRTDGTERTLYSSGEVILDELKHPVRMVGFAQDITERKMMEEKLEASVSLLHSILESTADGILAVDLHGRLEGHNQRFLDMWRLPSGVMTIYQDEMVLQSVLDQLKYPELFLAKVHELYQNPEQESMDVLEFKDGRIYERYSKAERTKEKITGRVWSFRDVTERYRALETLRRSEERYRSLVIASAQIVWVNNAEGYAMEESPTWGKFTGQTKDQMMGYGWLDAVHPTDRERVAQVWSQSVAENRVYETELCIRRADGQWREMVSRGVPIFGPNGKVREWMGSCRDITDRKRAEQRVMDERDFSDALINSLPGTFYLVDKNGAMMRWNKNLEIVTEYSTEEIKQMNASDFLPEEEKHLAAENNAKVIATGQSDAEITLLTKTGKRIPYYGTGRLVHLRGQPRLLGVAIDISELKRAEEEIKKLNQQLETRVRERTNQLDTSNKELRSFSYTVSHDLKAPLRAITGFTEAISEDCRDRLDAEHLAYLERIIQSAGRMGRLIDDLLTYSRIGRAAINLRPVPLNDVLRRMAGDIKMEIEAVGGKLIISPDLPVVNADPSLLNQIFSNLLENAISYRKADVPLEIAVNWRKEAPGATICVTDNGIGIAPSHFDRIFEVFQRLHTEQSYPGTGIGLANVKKAVEMQGGTVWVESEPGKGSTFCVQLEPVDS
ncbi:MAG: PAS domain S-box protein [Verrucomicrobia bacterium]|nr:PAS domain S-box protein [Verrucomicrobiota bacterium]